MKEANNSMIKIGRFQNEGCLANASKQATMVASTRIFMLGCYMPSTLTKGRDFIPFAKSFMFEPHEEKAKKDEKEWLRPSYCYKSI